MSFQAILTILISSLCATHSFIRSPCPVIIDREDSHQVSWWLSHKAFHLSRRLFEDDHLCVLLLRRGVKIAVPLLQHCWSEFGRSRLRGRKFAVSEAFG